MAAGLQAMTRARRGSPRALYVSPPSLYFYFLRRPSCSCRGWLAFGWATPAWWPWFHGTVNYECRTLLASIFLRRSTLWPPAFAMDSARSARVGAAFVILAFSLFGVTPPIVAAVRRQRGSAGVDTVHGGTSALSLRVKAFAAGVMLSLSVVHVMYDTFATLSELETSERYPLYAGYPMGGPFIVVGILWCAPAAQLRAVRSGRSKSAQSRECRSD